jgi:hypothetical protein
MLEGGYDLLPRGTALRPARREQRRSLRWPVNTGQGWQGERGLRQGSPDGPWQELPDRWSKVATGLTETQTTYLLGLYLVPSPFKQVV